MPLELAILPQELAIHTNHQSWHSTKGTQCELHMPSFCHSVLPTWSCCTGWAWSTPSRGRYRHNNIWIETFYQSAEFHIAILVFEGWRVCSSALHFNPVFIMHDQVLWRLIHFFHNIFASLGCWQVVQWDVFFWRERLFWETIVYPFDAEMQGRTVHVHDSQAMCNEARPLIVQTICKRWCLIYEENHSMWLLVFIQVFDTCNL